MYFKKLVCRVCLKKTFPIQRQEDFKSPNIDVVRSNGIKLGCNTLAAAWGTYNYRGAVQG
jgi:hypothetical protein